MTVPVAPRSVVIVSGIFSSEKTLAPLAQMLRGRGFDVTMAKLGGLGLQTVERDAVHIGEAVAEASARSVAGGGDGMVTLLGHSKGGISARWYLQHMGIEHVDQLITLGSPHQGALPLGMRLSKLAAKLPGLPWVRELVAGGPTMTSLNDELPGFLRAARAQHPDFRMVSIASDVDRFGIHGTDGFIKTREAVLNPAVPAGLRDARAAAAMVLPGTEDHLLRGMHHGAIAGLLGDAEPVLPLLTSKLERVS